MQKAAGLNIVGTPRFFSREEAQVLQMIRARSPRFCSWLWGLVRKSDLGSLGQPAVPVAMGVGNLNVWVKGG